MYAYISIALVRACEAYLGVVEPGIRFCCCYLVVVVVVMVVVEFFSSHYYVLGESINR